MDAITVASNHAPMLGVVLNHNLPNDNIDVSTAVYNRNVRFHSKFQSVFL